MPPLKLKVKTLRKMPNKKLQLALKKMLYVFIKAWRNTYNLLITYYSMDFVDYYYVVYDLLHKKKLLLNLLKVKQY